MLLTEIHTISDLFFFLKRYHLTHMVDGTESFFLNCFHSANPPLLVSLLNPEQPPLPLDKSFSVLLPYSARRAPLLLHLLFTSCLYFVACMWYSVGNKLTLCLKLLSHFFLLLLILPQMWGYLCVFFSSVGCFSVSSLKSWNQEAGSAYCLMATILLFLFLSNLRI